jgi:hypothetical protein
VVAPNVNVPSGFGATVAVGVAVLVGVAVVAVGVAVLVGVVVIVGEAVTVGVGVASPPHALNIGITINIIINIENNNVRFFICSSFLFWKGYTQNMYFLTFTSFILFGRIFKNWPILYT